MAKATQNVILEWNSKGEGAVARKAGQLGKNITNIDKKWQAVSKTALLAGTAMTATAGLIVRQTAKLDQAMADATAVTADLTDVQFDKMRKMAKEVGAEFGFMADKAARAFYYLGSAGMTAAEQIEAFPAVARLARAGSIDMARASETVADTLRGFNLEANQTNRVVDVMAKAVTSSNQNFEQLGQTLSYVSGVAQSAGWSLEQTVAVTEMMANVGIKGTRAGTALRRGILNLQAPTEETSKALKELGVNVYDVNGNARNAIDIFGDLSTSLNKGTQQQRMFALKAIFGARAIAGMSKVVQAGKTNLQELVTELENAGGTADDIAKKRLAKLTGQLEIFRAELGNLASELGDTIMPLLINLTKNATELVKKFRGMSEGTKKFIMSLTAFGGVGLLAVGTMMKMVSGLVRLIKFMGIAQTVSTALRLKLMGLAGAFAFTAPKVIELIDKIGKYKKALIEANTAQDLAKEKSHEALKVWEQWTEERLNSLKNEEKAYKLAKNGAEFYIRFLKENEDSLTETTKEHIRSRIQTLTDYYKNINYQEIKRTEKQKEESEKRIEANKIEAQIKEQQRQIEEEQLAEYYDRLAEMRRELEQSITLASMEGLQQELARINIEKENKIRAYEEELEAAKQSGLSEAKAEKQLAEYRTKVNVWAERKSYQVRQQFTQEKLNMAYDTASKMIDYTLKMFTIDKDTTRKQLRLYQSLIAAQQALAIARLWAAEASKGILGLATAAVGTVSIIAQMKKQSEALQDQWKSTREDIEKPIAPELSAPELSALELSAPELDIGEKPVRPENATPEEMQKYNEELKNWYSKRTKEIEKARSGIDRIGRETIPEIPTRTTRGLVGGANKINVNIREIRTNLNIDRLEGLQEENLRELLERISKAVKDKTIEGLEMAFNVGDAIAMREREKLA